MYIIILNNISIKFLLRLGLALSWFQKLLNNGIVLPRRYLIFILAMQTIYTDKWLGIRYSYKFRQLQATVVVI